jgi:hypothetical protein
MRINQLFNFTLLMTLIGIPVGGLLLSEPAIAQQRSNLNFQNINISSVGIQTISGIQTTYGVSAAITTIVLSIQNNDLNSRLFNYSERVSLGQIQMVDAQRQSYNSEIDIDLDKPFFYGENRLVKLRIIHPMGINPSYLQLNSGDSKKPIYIRL